MNGWSDEGDIHTHLQSPQDLVDKELHMLVSEGLLLDDVVQVRAHQVCHQISAGGGGGGGGGDYKGEITRRNYRGGVTRGGGDYKRERETNRG